MYEQTVVESIIAELDSEDKNRSLDAELPQKANITTEDGASFKVRLYPNDVWAARQEALLQEIQVEVKTPRLAGRLDRYLVFEHKDVELVQIGERDSEVHIGRFLGRLAMYTDVSIAAEKLDVEFMDWLNVLAKVGFLPRRLRLSMIDRYEELRPVDPHICMDYWDAMPHNFGWHRDEFVLLDEKHLRYSFEGVGLVKPSILLDEKEFDSVLKGYEEIASSDFYRRSYSFLRFYYWVAALYFYALRGMDGVKHIPANPRLRSYRLGLMQEAGLGLFRRAFEEFLFSVLHPWDSLIFFMNHMLEPLSWFNVLRRATSGIMDAEGYET
jgi:hypothetical protein